MKISTLVVVLLAAALGGYVYYSEVRHPTPKPEEGASKPLYKFESGDVTSITLTRLGESAPIILERQTQGWVLTSPVKTRADQNGVETLASSLAHAASSRTLPADPKRLKEYGLEPPAATVEIHLKKGQTEKLELGAKDFSGMAVYAREGDAKDLLLVPDSVLSAVTRSLLDLRDRDVLELPNWSVTELDFRTPKTKFRLEKKGDDWNLIEPQKAPADSDEASNLTTALSSGRFTSVAEEQAPDRAADARYGLTTPEVTVHVRNEEGGEATLLIGKKDGSSYYARDTGRSLVFRVQDSLVKKFLDASYAGLRDKHILRAEEEDFSRLTVHNEKLTLTATRTSAGKWQVTEPAALKGKTLNVWHVFDPLNTTRATEVIEHPSAAILGKLAKPAVEIKLTGAKGAVTTVEVSAKDGNVVYARSSATPVVYKMDPYVLVQLNFTAEQAAS